MVLKTERPLIRWMHQKRELLRGFSVTPGGKIVKKIAGVSVIAILSPVIVASALLMVPTYGLVYAIDTLSNRKDYLEHKERMQNDINYRLSHTLPRMLSSLRFWQADITKNDQYVRNMLAIKELNDIPYEVWHYDLSASTQFNGLMKAYGTPDYSDIKDRCVSLAIDYYIEKYQELHKFESFEKAKESVEKYIRGRV